MRLVKANIDGCKVQMPDGWATTARKAAGGLLAHRAAKGSRAFALTTPSGYALGNAYLSMQAALDAAKIMAPDIIDATASDVIVMFGTETKARAAYAAARAFMYGGF